MVYHYIFWQVCTAAFSPKPKEESQHLWQSWVHKRFGKAGCCAEELYVHHYYYGKHAQVLQHNLSHLLKTMLANGLETCLLTNEKYRPQALPSFIAWSGCSLISKANAMSEQVWILGFIATTEVGVIAVNSRVWIVARVTAVDDMEGDDSNFQTPSKMKIAKS